MAVLHKEYIAFNKEIKLSDSRKESLQISRKELRKKIRKWFSENKPNELQPKFWSQGSFEMNTGVNPIPFYDNEGNKILRYDLDDGIYFIENPDEDNRRAIETWHDWVFESVDNHTSKQTIRKQTCVRVVFADGHYIDLPIYYNLEQVIELAHRSKGWIESDPLSFYKWFNDLKNKQLERIVRFLKAWKDYEEFDNSSLKLPSGFELTILAAESYIEDDNDDVAFRETIRAIFNTLNKPNGFRCLRPTTPKGEDVFSDYSESRKTDFLNALSALISNLDRANSEENFKTASEIIRNNVFGTRFPIGEDKRQEEKSNSLSIAIGSALITPKPYGY
jgi:hypothetical protein